MLQVVLIDDEYFFRNSLKKAIPWEKYGFEIIGDANNGRDGLKLICEKKPDIAIIDINMPLITGLDLIERLREMHNNCKCILLTGYGDFKYAQKAIRLNVSEYILKPVDFTLLLESLNSLKEEITEEQKHRSHVKDLEEHRNQSIKENFMLDIISGHVSFNEVQLASYLEELHICVSFKSYTITLAEFPQASSARIEELLQYMWESVYGKENCELIAIRRSLLCIIRETISLENSIAETTALASYLHTRNIEFQLGLSRIHNDTQEVIMAYNEASVSQRNGRNRNTGFIPYSNLTPTAYHIAESMSADIRKYIRQKDEEMIKNTLDTIYTGFKKEELSYDNVIFCTYELLSTLLSALNEQNSMNFFMSRSSRRLFDVLDSFDTTDELKKWVTELFLEQLHRESDTSSKSSVTQKVEEYVMENYSNPELTIDEIAKNLYSNYSYLCYCFKRDRGATINDFINQVRLDKALQLFQSGVDNVSYVAEVTGFNNAGYFSRRFKKAIGLPPSEYIKTL